MSHHEQRNKERPPEEYAVHTLDSLHKMMHIWICDFYHPKIQKKLGTSPYKMWKELTSLMPVRLPASQEHLDLACTIPTTRKLQAYGVEVCYLRTFCNEELERLLRRYGKSITVEVRYKPYKLDRVWVKDPGTNEWFIVENYDLETRNTTEWQQEQAQKIIRDEMKAHDMVLSLAEALEKLRSIGRNLQSAKPMAQRRRALKMLGLLPEVNLIDEPVEAPKPEQPKKAKTTASRPAPNVVKPELVREKRAEPPAPSYQNKLPTSGGYFAVKALPVM
jgi:putative transposase